MIYKVTLNGKIYEVEVEKGEAVIQAEYDAALPTQAIEVQQPLAPVQSAPQIASVAPTVANASANAIKAPMPGNINAVKVQSGQAVKKGDLLIILEAMKMENEVVAPSDGTVASIDVTEGSSVEAGAVLATLD